MSFASAVWYLPWTWFDDPINNTQQEGKLFIIENPSEWNAIKATGEESELTFWSSNKSDKKTEIGWLLPEGETCSDNKWKDDKNTYKKDGTKIKNDKNSDLKIKCKNNACDGQSCYHLKIKDDEAINIDEYVKLGENSFIIEYQNVSTLNYQLDFGEANITLFKNVSNDWSNTVNEVFVYYNNDSYKFGANDSSNDDLNEYKYQIKSDIPIYQYGNTAYVKNPVKIINFDSSHYETHEFDFTDVCSREFNAFNTTEEIDGENYTITQYNQTANCEYNSYEVWNRNETTNYTDEENETVYVTTEIFDYFLEVTFVSDKILTL